MKLLHVIDSMDPERGGPSQGIRNSLAALEKLGITREVVCLDEAGKSLVDTDEFPIHSLGIGSGPWHYNNRLIPWLIENLPRFDFVISNGLWLFPSYATFAALKKLRKQRGAKLPKFFVMPHGMLDPYFQKAEDRRLKAARNWLFWKLIESRVVNGADALLFTCETELKLARTTFKPYHPRKELNVSYGILPPPDYTDDMAQAFFSKCPEVANDQKYLLFLSRIHKKKGVDMLLEVYLELLTNGAKTGKSIPKLVVAGPGIDSEFGRSLKNLTEHPLLKDRVFFPGMLTGDAKWGAFYGCEAFILPSHQENFGIAVAEALACSKPVLITDQINIWREIDHEKGGITVPDTTDDIKTLIEKWIDLDAADKKAMGENAYATYEKYFRVTEAAKMMADALMSR